MVQTAMVDKGTGVPVVLIPGVQGRWEWMSDTVDALAERCRVLTFSLCDEPTSGFRFEREAGFDAYLGQIDEALRRARVQKAVVIGVSYGGLIAAEFALRRPSRVAGLVLVSALPIGWQPDRRARFYLRAPRLLSPVFCIASPARMLPELRATLPLGPRVRFILRCALRATRARISPARMARRVRVIEQYAFSDPSAIQVPTLVTTGEDDLDRIVSPALTRQYLACVPDVRYVVLPRTGHSGSVTRPFEFAAVVHRFCSEIPADVERISA